MTLQSNNKGWRRRDVLGALVATGGAAFLGLRPQLTKAGTLPPPETPSIRIHDAPITCFAPTYVAGELLKLEGFTDVQYVKTGLNEGPSKALAEGHIDFTMNDPPGHLLELNDKDAPITLLGGIHTGCWELMGSDKIRTLRDLKGKKVAAPQRSSREAFVAAILASVGVDPDKDIIWVHKDPGESMKLFAEGKVDGFMGFAPEPQELRSRGIGHSILNTQTDRPWSQYFCCLAAVRSEYLRKYPVATKRALRSFYKAAEICVNEPELAARIMVDAGVSDKYEYVLQSVKEIGYYNWKHYNSEDTMRFWALRLRESGIIDISPKKVLAEHCDWRISEELKKELKV